MDNCNRRKSEGSSREDPSCISYHALLLPCEGVGNVSGKGAFRVLTRGYIHWLSGRMERIQINDQLLLCTVLDEVIYEKALHGGLTMRIKQCSISTHTSLYACNTGLYVSTSYPFLTAPPDGAVVDTTAPTPYGFLEIKCPYAQRNLTPVEAYQCRHFSSLEMDSQNCSTLSGAGPNGYWREGLVSVILSFTQSKALESLLTRISGRKSSFPNLYPSERIVWLQHLFITLANIFVICGKDK